MATRDVTDDASNPDLSAPGDSDKVLIVDVSTTPDSLKEATVANLFANRTMAIKDANFTIQDDGDTSKQAKFQASGITAGQTRTITIPDADLTIVGTATTQTLTNKTLTTPTIADFINATHAHTAASSGGTLTTKDTLGGSAGNNTIASGTTAYLYIFAGVAPSTTEADTQFGVPVGGTLRNFRVRTRSAQPGTGSLVFTVRVAAANTSITATVASGAAAGLVSDTSNTASISAGQNLSISVVNNASSASAQIAMWSLELDVST